jgi:DNA polymerase III sliding clamp (beta) subunit (PCNA family)
LKAAQKAALAAARAGAILPLRGLLLEADRRAGAIRLTSSDTAVSVSVTVPAHIEAGGGAVIANPRLLLDYLAVNPQGELTLALNQNEHALTIESDTCNARLDIKTFPESEYPKPEVPMPGETVYVSGLGSLIAKTVFAASGNGPAVISECVKLTLGDDGITAEALSGFTVAKSKGDPEAKGSISLLVPAEALRILARISDDKDIFELGIAGDGENGKTAVFFDGMILFSARLAESKFPDTETFLSVIDEAVRVKVKTKDLLDALSRAAVFALPKDNIEILFSDGQMHLKCKRAGMESSGGVPVSDFRKSASAPDSHFFNAAKLAELLKAADGEATLVISNRGHLLIRTGNSRFLQLGCVPGRSEEKKETAGKTAA